ncbi:large proline-rich protein BAG6-like isoform X2 [Ruditapes philippinarum]|uniref:large proline-rich protein BAG6-like isoform X2 n=1 Tax=Ruditapes philippinarum TaxID=129788 RepID=UPI00295AF01B|nr:large proline-rich protein BAG6-like isoform X2 [Ruditapes philippinarum]
MLDVTVKTLDGQNRSFSVPENTTVRQFKEKISNSISILPDTQRLIFQGRVLQDDKLLKDYDVHGKVVHVVLRPPPGSGRPAGNDNHQPSTAPPGRDVNSVVVGSFSLPSDIIDTNMNIAQEAIRSMGDMGRNARVSTRTSPDGSAVDVHIHLGPVQTGATVSEAQMRLNTARQMMRLATEALNQLENPEGTNNTASNTQTANTEPVPAAGSSGAQETQRDTEKQSVPSPMDTSDTSEPSSSQTGGATPSSTEPGSTQGSARSSPTANQGTETSSTDQSNSTQQQNGSQQPRGPVRPNVSALGEVLVEVNELNRRLQPHIERFTRIVQDDGEMNENEQRENQRVCNMVPEAMHAVSHAYHAISDLMVDLGQNRPRQLYVTLAIAQPHTAVIQQAIPVQAQIQVGGSPRLIRRQFAANRASQVPTNTTQAPSVAVPSSVSGLASSTTTTGTSTGPQPATVTTGTQSNEAAGTQPPTSSFGAQHDAGISNEEMQRITQQMSAGLQNVLGQGLRQGDGTPDNPYVFVEMGPDSMTVNSISAEVVTTDENGVQTTHTSETDSTAGSVGTTNVPAPPQTGSPATAPPDGQQGADQGQGGILPPNFIQSLVQQIVSQTGQGQPQRMQINIGQGPAGMMGMSAPGMPMGIRLGPRIVRPPGMQRNESGTQTAGANGIPANSGTQTFATPTSASGTQTSTGVSTPSSTSGTQTPGAPRAAAFVVPGMPGLAQNISPVDQYLPCSSRYFLSQHARGIINQTGGPQNTETALADMVSNLMSGLIGGPQPSGAQASGTATPTTATGTPASSTTGSDPRPTGIRIGAPGATFQLGGMPGFPVGLGGMFRGQMPFMQGMRFRVGTPRQNMPGARPQQAQQASNTTGTPGQGSTPATSGTQGSTGGSEPQFVQMLRTMLSSAGQQQGQQPGNQSSNATTTGSQQQTGTQSAGAISDEAFTQLVSGITGYMSQAAVGQAPRQTIAEFLSDLGQNYGIPQGEGFINDIMSCILSHLQITDLISVFYGSPAPLNQVQRPLREFISTRVLNDLTPCPENIRTSVEELVESMQTEIQETVNSTQPRPHIDFLATLNHFLNQQFYNVVSLIMNARDGDVHFGQDLYACVRRLLSELFILSSRCLGGMQNVERMVSQRLQSLTTGVNPFIQDWMAAMTNRQISQFIPTIIVTEGEISHYLVYKEVGQPSAGASSSQAAKKTSEVKKTASKSSTPSSGSGSKRDSSPIRAPSPKRVSVPSRQEKRKREVEPMETSSPVSSSPGASAIEVDNQRTPPVSEVKGAASANGNSKPPAPAENHPSPSGAQTVNGDWQSVVPPEWVEVITQDIEKQRNQPQQRPHSDVYLQGVPPKRRRMMTQDRPGDLSNTSEVLPESIRRAVAAAAVEPISSLENLSSEVTNDTDLQQAFETNLSNTLSQRVNNDKDFKPERFPNTEEYFHKGSDKKK